MVSDDNGTLKDTCFSFGALCRSRRNDHAAVPKPEGVAGWTRGRYTDALRHDQANTGYNQSFRQLLHVGFKVAAKMEPRYLKALRANEEVVAKNVTTNLFERHIKPMFPGL